MTTIAASANGASTRSSPGIDADDYVRLQFKARKARPSSRTFRRLSGSTHGTSYCPRARCARAARPPNRLRSCCQAVGRSRSSFAHFRGSPTASMASSLITEIGSRGGLGSTLAASCGAELDIAWNENDHEQTRDPHYCDNTDDAEHEIRDGLAPAAPPSLMGWGRFVLPAHGNELYAGHPTATLFRYRLLRKPQRLHIARASISRRRQRDAERRAGSALDAAHSPLRLDDQQSLLGPNRLNGSCPVQRAVRW